MVNKNHHSICLTFKGSSSVIVLKLNAANSLRRDRKHQTYRGEISGIHFRKPEKHNKCRRIPDVHLQTHPESCRGFQCVRVIDRSEMSPKSSGNVCKRGQKADFINSERWLKTCSHNERKKKKVDDAESSQVQDRMVKMSPHVSVHISHFPS